MSSTINTITNKYKIIVVDDNKDILNLFGLVLQLDGYKVSRFTNLVYALNKLKNNSKKINKVYHIIITPADSPIKYIFELTEIIRKFNSNMKIILTSALDKDNDNAVVLPTTQFYGYLKKPINMITLEELLENV